MSERVPPLALAMAATRLAERLFDHLRETDPETLKRLLDAAREQAENALLPGRPPHPNQELFEQSCSAELDLLHRLFARL